MNNKTKQKERESGRMKERMQELTNEWMHDWRNEWTNERIRLLIDEAIDVYRLTEEWTVCVLLNVVRAVILVMPVYIYIYIYICIYMRVYVYMCVYVFHRMLREIHFVPLLNWSRSVHTHAACVECLRLHDGNVTPSIMRCRSCGKLLHYSWHSWLFPRASLPSRQTFLTCSLTPDGVKRRTMLC